MNLIKKNLVSKVLFFTDNYIMEKSVKKILSFAAVLFIALNAFNAAALEVDENEIRSAGADSVEFENYGGPHSIIESVEAITGIGTALGTELSSDIELARTIQPGAKYSVIHAINSEDDGLLNADIFVLGENAGVDHITNLRRILTGFLYSAYNYTWDDAQTLATFLTVYNAVYRGQLDDLSPKYKDIVIQNLDERKAGLSRNWEDWAGFTQILIPLKDVSEEAAPVETSTISDDKVIEALRQEDDKSIDEREKMVDLKEREIESATQKAQNAQKDAVQKKKEGNKEGAKQSAKTSNEQQKIADKKRTEVQSEKQNIAKDKEEILSVPQIEYTSGLFGSDKKGFYHLLNLNGHTGEILKKSSMTQIRSKAVYAVQAVTLVQDGTTLTYPQMFVAICGEKSGKSAVRLCLIDSESLELKAENTEIISESSDLVPYSDRFFVIIQQDKKNYIAAYDKNLTLKNRSSIEVNPSTPFNITEQGLLITDSSGNPCMLSLNDLSTIWQAQSKKDEK